MASRDKRIVVEGFSSADDFDAALAKWERENAGVVNPFEAEMNATCKGREFKGLGQVPAVSEVLVGVGEDPKVAADEQARGKALLAQGRMVMEAERRAKDEEAEARRRVKAAWLSMLTVWAPKGGEMPPDDCMVPRISGMGGTRALIKMDPKRDYFQREDRDAPFRTVDLLTGLPVVIRRASCGLGCRCDAVVTVDVKRIKTQSAEGERS